MKLRLIAVNGFMLTILMGVSTCGVKKQPESRSQVAATYNCIAFTDKSRKPWSTLVNCSGGPEVKLQGPYQVRQYLKHRELLILISGSQLWQWKLSGEPSLILNLADAVPELRSESLPFGVAFSDSSEVVAVCGTFGLRLVSSNSGDIIRQWTASQIEKETGRSATGSPFYVSASWNASGDQVAFSMAAEPPAGDDDGIGRSHTFVASVNGKLRYLGEGIPISWLSSNSLLLAVERAGDMRITWRISMFGGQSLKGSQYGSSVSWNGKHILLFGDRCFEVIDPASGKTIEKVQLEQYRDERLRLPRPSVVSFEKDALSFGTELSE